MIAYASDERFEEMMDRADSLVLVDFFATWCGPCRSELPHFEEMYKKYGNYVHTLKSFTCEGAEGMERMQEIMSDLRENPPAAIGGFKVLKVADYIKSVETVLETGATTEITLPKSDVLTFTLENNFTVVIRPSGTEPKIKSYYTTIAPVREDAVKYEQAISADFKKILGF